MRLARSLSKFSKHGKERGRPRPPLLGARSWIARVTLILWNARTEASALLTGLSPELVTGWFFGLGYCFHVDDVEMQ